MLHPFERLDAGRRKRSLVALLVALVVTQIALVSIDAQYHTPAAPSGIVHLELAGKPAVAQMILDSWERNPAMNLWVALGIGFDYLYLVVYGLTFAMASAMIAARLSASSPGAARIARVVAYLQFLAPLCDAVENVGLFAMLARYGTTPWAAITAGFALVKFACVGMALTLFVVAGPIAYRAKPS